MNGLEKIDLLVKLGFPICYINDRNEVYNLLERLTKEQMDNFRDNLSQIMNCAWYQSQILLKASVTQLIDALILTLTK
jgi:hypothetical protein